MCCALNTDRACSATIDSSLPCLAAVSALTSALKADLGLPVCYAAGKKGLTHMRLDGEPWAQPFPAKGAAEGPLKVSSFFPFSCICMEPI